MHVLAIRRHGPFTGFRFREAACVQTVSCGTARARLRRRAIELSLQDGATNMALGSPLTLTDLGGNQYTELLRCHEAEDLCVEVCHHLRSISVQWQIWGGGLQAVCLNVGGRAQSQQCRTEERPSADASPQSCSPRCCVGGAAWPDDVTFILKY